MALRHKHITIITRILFKVRNEASKKYEDNPEHLAIAYGLVDTLGLMLALFFETEMSNFETDKFLFRFGYGTGIKGEGAVSILGDQADKLETVVPEEEDQNAET